MCIIGTLDIQVQGVWRPWLAVCMSSLKQEVNVYKRELFISLIENYKKVSQSAKLVCDKIR